MAAEAQQWYLQQIRFSIKSAGSLENAKKLFNKNVIPIKRLVEKIGDLSRITVQQKNFFLYNESNYINHTFYTELSKKVQTYGVISAPAIGIKTAHLITPTTSLKFRITEEV